VKNKKMIILVLIATILSNYIGYKIYRNSNILVVNQYYLIWMYISSVFARYINTSFFIPLVFIFIENKFHFIQKQIDSNIKIQELKEKDVLENKKRRLIMQEDKRLCAINNFGALIEEITEHSSNVKFIDHDDKVEIKKLCIMLNSLYMKGNDIINDLSRRLKLMYKDELICVRYINLIIDPVIYTCHYLYTSDDKQSKRNLQNAMGIVSESVNSNLFHPIMLILKNYNQIHEEFENSVQKEKIIQTILEIKYKRKYSKKWLDDISQIEAKNNQFVPESIYPEFKMINKIAKESINNKAIDYESLSFEYSKHDDIKIFESISKGANINNIHYLARKMAYDSIVHKIENEINRN
jgi:hypothetical protein